MHGQGRMLGVDSLRGLAALSVVLYHYTTRFDELYGHPGGAPLAWPYGEYGVMLFFVISGLVIFRTLDRTPSVTSFLWNRATRLFPAYWAAVVITYAIVTLVGLPGREVPAAAALVNLTMVQTALSVPHVDGVYWSLYVELMFYALLAALYAAGLRTLATVSLAALAGVHLLDTVLPLREAVPGWWRLDHLRLMPYAHLFLAGILVHKLRGSGWTRPRAGAAALVAGVVLAEGLWGDWPLGHLLAVPALVALVWLATGPRSAWLEHRLLLFLGSISYSLYLIHQNVGYMLLRAGYALGMGPEAVIALTLLAAVAMAAALAYAVEKPALVWLRARGARRSG